MAMTAKITWLGERAFLGESGSGHAVVMDGAPGAGGRNIGFRPMEMMLLGLGGCTAFDVVMILERSRQKVTGCEIALEGERAETDPKVYTRVKLVFTLKGHELKPAVVERAIRMSEEKYCSASAMFQHTAEFETEWKIVDAAEG